MSQTKLGRRPMLGLFALAALFVWAAVSRLPVPVARGEGEPAHPTLELSPTDDTTIHAESPAFNEGGNRVLFVGTDAQGAPRRALMAFDLDSEIPPGSQILSASLTLFVDDVASADSCIVSLFRVRSPWGEGDAGQALGGATWSHAYYDSVAWAKPGGDARPFPSGGMVVLGVGAYSIGGDLLAADLQSMLDDPASNHGWILAGSENVPDNWKQLGSGDNSSPASRPRLTIQYSPLVKSLPIGSGRLKSRYRP